MLFLLGYIYAFSAVQEHRSQAQLFAQFRGLLDPASVVGPPLGGDIASGTPVALLNIPSLDLSKVVVVEGTTSGDLAKGPGHQRNSPLPGQVGESIVMGRSVSYGAPFAGLAHVRLGALISATTGQGTFRFRVEDLRVAGSRLPVIPKNASLLTLISSTDAGLFGVSAPSHLIYVDAALLGTPAPTPPGQVTEVSAASLQGSSDSGAWPWVLLWTFALVVVVSLSVVLVRRWGLGRTWIVAAPTLLLVVWVLSEQVTRLLPNVY